MGDACEIVIPREASVAAPYAISLVKDGPNPNAGRLWLNFIMSDVGQRLFAQGFVRPSRRDVSLPAEAARAHARRTADPPLDVVKAAARKAEVDQLWTQAIQAR